MSGLFNAFIYNPLYNGLVFIINHMPAGDIGFSIILFTLVVKIVLMPLSKGAVVTQLKMKQLEPEMAAIREKYKDNKEEQAKKTLEFYKLNKLNPFAGIFLVLIQLPIILALAFIFLKNGFPTIHTEVLYSFVPVPEHINTMFLGLIDIAKRSIWLGVLAGVSQFFQIWLSVPAYKKPETASSKPSFQDDFAKSMNMQMRYVLPAVVFFISLGVSGAVALYWITSNLFTIAQELYFRRTVKKDVVA